MRQLSNRARVLAAVIALTVIMTVVAALGGPLARAIVIVTLSVLLTATTAWRVWHLTGVARGVFLVLLGSFLVLNAAASVLLLTHVTGTDLSETLALWQGLLGLSYLFMLGAASVLVARTIKSDSGGILDAATIATAVASAIWQAFLAPAMETTDANVAQRAYVFVVVMALTGSIGIVVGLEVNNAIVRSTRPVMRYFIVALAVTVAGNALGAVYASPTTHVPDAWVYAVWPAAFIAAWGAIAHPGSPEVFLTQSTEPSRLTPRRIAMLGVALIITPAISVIRTLSGGYVGFLTGALSTMAIAALVMTRVHQLAVTHRDAEARLRVMADHDVLTGLPNRRTVDHHLDALVARVNKGEAPGAVVCFIDLNDFKLINDTRGHAAGDQLLIAIGTRLARLVRQDGRDIVGRLGGDEFIMVIEAEVSVADSVTARVGAAFDEPFILQDGPTDASASIGVAVARQRSGTTMDELLTEADHAMYHHKRGRSKAPAAPTVS